MAIGKDALELQKYLEYEFKNIAYLDCALTHSSYTNEQRSRGVKAPSNERLEFLGDAVLGQVISEYLFREFRNYREGALTKMRQHLVCEKTLSIIAKELSLGDYINIGRGEELTDCRRRPKILADSLEAIIAAVYIDSRDGDIEAPRRLIERLFRKEIDTLATSQKTDYKTMLQQLAEQDGSAILEYRVVSETGPEHEKSFTVIALMNNNEVGRGTAPTKKQAEMEAARLALILFGVAL